MTNLDLIRQLQRIYQLASRRAYPFPKGQKPKELNDNLLETLKTIASLAYKAVSDYEGDDV